MSLQSPRTSVFTFQSAGHSSNVLQCLNEQRQKDVLCDVTVVVEGRTFRAHLSVLASCSDYFHSRITSHCRHGVVMDLPDKVTVMGFEPLLQFAYTSKLLFTKENIQAIHTSAEILRFHDLETACFDFLIPKFLDSHRNAQEDRRKSCCRKRTFSICLENNLNKDQLADEHLQNRHGSQKTGKGISQSTPNVSITKSSSESQSPVPPSVGNSQGDISLQCPLNQQIMVSSEQEENQDCCSEMPLLTLTSSSGGCPILALSCSDNSKTDAAVGFCDQDILDIGDGCDQYEKNVVNCSLPCELPSSENINAVVLREGTGGERDQTHVRQEGSCGPCPPEMSGMEQGDEIVKQRSTSLGETVVVAPTDPALSGWNPEEGYGERSSVEREVAEHLAKGFWTDLCPSQAQPFSLETMDHTSLGKDTDFHWMKQLDLSSSTGDCPFLRDLGAGEAETPNPWSDSLSQSGKSPYTSSVNSAEDSDLDTDVDIEANNRRAQEVRLPFPVQQITSLSRSAFQQLLRRQQLTSDQLEFVHDIRRRSKNRVAAQRCRKRKLDSIYKLETEIHKLKSEKEKLIVEHGQLKQSLEETHQNLSSLCQSLCGEAAPQTDQLQLLVKLSSPELPISALLTPLASPCPSLSLQGREQDTMGSMAMESCLLKETPIGETDVVVLFSDPAEPELPQPSSDTERNGTFM